MNRLSFKKASLEDSTDLLVWRNDPLTRENSFNPLPVSQEEHDKWFSDSLGDSDRTIFIALNSSREKIGQIRFDRKGEIAEVDVTVAPDYRGRGYGCAIIEEGSSHYVETHAVRHLVAKVKKGNTPSMRAFQKAGFKPRVENPDYIELRRDYG